MPTEENKKKNEENIADAEVIENESISTRSEQVEFVGDGSAQAPEVENVKSVENTEEEKIMILKMLPRQRIKK